MDKITSINGILLTAHNDFYEHEKNNSVHITEDERTAWNSKAEASEVNSKVSTETFDAHKAGRVSPYHGRGAQPMEYRSPLG